MLKLPYAPSANLGLTAPRPLAHKAQLAHTVGLHKQQRVIPSPPEAIGEGVGVW